MAPRIALVLSGGGAKGAYQAGVLKAIDELALPIDLVVGTSAGAINALFFAINESRSLYGDLNGENSLWFKIKKRAVLKKRRLWKAVDIVAPVSLLYIVLTKIYPAVCSAQTFLTCGDDQSPGATLTYFSLDTLMYVFGIIWVISTLRKRLKSKRFLNSVIALLFGSSVYTNRGFENVISRELFKVLRGGRDGGRLSTFVENVQISFRLLFRRASFLGVLGDQYISRLGAGLRNENSNLRQLVITACNLTTTDSTSFMFLRNADQWGNYWCAFRHKYHSVGNHLSINAKSECRNIIPDLLFGSQPHLRDRPEEWIDYVNLSEHPSCLLNIA